MITIPVTGITQSSRPDDTGLICNFHLNLADGYEAVFNMSFSRANAPSDVPSTDPVGIPTLDVKSLDGIVKYAETWLKRKGYWQLAKFVRSSLSSLWTQAGA